MKRKYMNVVLSEDEFVISSEFFPLDDNDYENYPYLLEGDAVCEQEVIEAMEEAKRISKDPSVKGYTDLNEMFEELDKWYIKLN